MSLSKAFIFCLVLVTLRKHTNMTEKLLLKSKHQYKNIKICELLLIINDS